MTVEDILEEVFGELQDEFDREAELIRYGPERVFLRGDAPLLYVNDQLLLNLPDEHADTVGGLVIDALERSCQGGRRGRNCRGDAGRREASRRTP